MRSNSWTQAEEEWLRSAYPTHLNAELAGMHAELFPDRPRRTVKSINSRAKVLHLRKVDGFDRHPDRFWTPEKVEWFRAFVPGHSESEISAEHARLYGTPLTEGQIGNSKSRFGVKSGTFGGRFVKGDGRCVFASDEHRRRFVEAGMATRFKMGEVHDRPDGWIKPIGHERVDKKDGYVYVKVRDSIADGIQEQRPGNFNSNYRPKHHVVYEQVHGAVPPGCNVVFADHDKRNFDPANLVAVPRSLWSVISHRGLAYHDAESLKACMAVASLDKAVYAARCRPRKCKRCGAEFRPRFANQRTCDGCLGREG